MATLIDRRVTSKQHHGSRSGHCSTRSEMQVSARTTRISTKTTSWFTVIRVQCPNVPQHVPQICHRTHTHTPQTQNKKPTHRPGAGSNPRHRPLNLFSFSFFSNTLLCPCLDARTHGSKPKGPETDDRTMTREDNTPSMTIITTSEEVIRERCSPVTLELVQETPDDNGQTHAQ